MTLTTHPGPDAVRPMAPVPRTLAALPEADREALYRAALGPWGAAHYLPRFAAMDASGRRALGWNWAASLCTLNWLALRKLWGVALVYVALLEGALLLLWGLGWVWWQWPAPVLWGVAGALILAAVVLPGLLGTGWLHRALHQQIQQALAHTHSLRDAQDWLQRQAGTARRLHALLGLNLLVLAGVAGGAWLALSPAGTSTTPAPAAAIHPASTGRIVSGKIAETAPLASNAPPSALMPLPTPQDPRPALPINPPTSPTQTPSPPPTPALAPQPATAPKPTLQPAPEPVPPQTAPAPSKPGHEATRAAKPSNPAKETRSAERPARPSTATALPSRNSNSSSTAPNTGAPGTAPGFYLNVGLFAEEANALRAVERLQKAKLPAFRQTLVNRHGERHRVRVGPYASRTESEKAAAKVQLLGLDAQIFRKGD